MNPETVENKEQKKQEGQNSEQQKLKEYQSKKVSFNDYLQQKHLHTKKKAKTPLVAKIISMTPFVLIGCFGLFFIPYIFYTIIIAPDAVEYEEDGVTPIFSEAPAQAPAVVPAQPDAQ